MRFLVFLALIGCIGISGCGPANPKPVAEGPPSVDPSKKPPVDPNPEKKPEWKPPAVDPDPPMKDPLPTDVSGLIEAFKKPETLDGAVGALKAKGAVVIPTLIQALDQSRGDERIGILLTLGSFGKQASAAIPALKKLMETTKEDATRDAAQFTIDAIEGN